jgi:hypothetical protein
MRVSRIDWPIGAASGGKLPCRLPDISCLQSELFPIVILPSSRGLRAPVGERRSDPWNLLRCRTEV